MRGGRAPERRKRQQRLRHIRAAACTHVGLHRCRRAVQPGREGRCIQPRQRPEQRWQLLCLERAKLLLGRLQQKAGVDTQQQ